MLLSLVTAVATFLLCAWIARILTRPIAHMHWLLQDMHDAFAFTDPHVIVAFVVGLACSAALLYRRRLSDAAGAPSERMARIQAH